MGVLQHTPSVPDEQRGNTGRRSLHAFSLSMHGSGSLKSVMRMLFSYTMAYKVVRVSTPVSAPHNTPASLSVPMPLRGCSFFVQEAGSTLAHISVSGAVTPLKTSYYTYSSISVCEVGDKTPKPVPKLERCDCFMRAVQEKSLRRVA